MAGLAVVLTILCFPTSIKLLLGPPQTPFSGSHLPLHLGGFRNTLSPMKHEPE